MYNQSQNTLHRHHIHGEQKPVHIGHTTNHIHSTARGVNCDNPAEVRKYTADLVAQINSSRKIIRDTKEIPLKRTHLQLLKERLSQVHRLMSQYHFLKVPAESLIMVEGELFHAEREMASYEEKNGRDNPADLIKRINECKARKEYDEAEKLLLHCISLSESSSEIVGVSPWYYEQISEIYRIRREFAKEVSILERYLKKDKAPGTRRGHLYEKLIDARKLVSAHGAKG